MTEIRSFRRVFELERRIYRVDSIRLNPTGIPVRGVVYFLGALACAQLLAMLPLLGPVVAIVPWYLRALGVPAAVAVVLGLIRIEGRHFHLAALAVGRFALARRAAGRRPGPPVWRPAEIVFLPDGSDATMRALRYAGPGMLVVRVPHSRTRRARGRGRRASDGLVLTAQPGASARPVAIEVGPGGRVRTAGTGAR